MGVELRVQGKYCQLWSLKHMRESIVTVLWLWWLMIQAATLAVGIAYLQSLASYV